MRNLSNLSQCFCLFWLCVFRNRLRHGGIFRTQQGLSWWSGAEAAEPGDAMGLQGSGFGSDPTVWLARVTGNERVVTPNVKLKILTKSTVFRHGA